jgi:hypothetical protein
MSAREAVIVLDKLDLLKGSVENCHPQVPSLSVETALVIEKYANSRQLDEFFANKSLEDLNKLTKQFEDNCSCQEEVNISSRPRNRDKKEYL